MPRTLKFKDVKTGTKFIGTLVGLGALKKPENFIKIEDVSSVRLPGSRWNAVRLTDGNLCAFASIIEVKIIRN